MLLSRKLLRLHRGKPSSARPKPSGFPAQFDEGWPESRMRRNTNQPCPAGDNYGFTERADA